MSKESTFDLFWDLYNYKVGAKHKCKTNWDKKSKKEQDLIFRFLEEVYLKRDFVGAGNPNKYKKQPYTFLNSKIWESEGEWNKENTIFVDDEVLIDHAARLKKKIESTFFKIATGSLPIRHSYLNKMINRYNNEFYRENNQYDKQYYEKILHVLNDVNNRYLFIKDIEGEITERMTNFKYS